MTVVLRLQQAAKGIFQMLIVVLQFLNKMLDEGLVKIPDILSGLSISFLC